MRKVYQFDGCNGGTVSVIECAEPEQVEIQIVRDEQALKVRLHRDEWRDLCGLSYNVQFALPDMPPVPETLPLAVVK